MHDFQPKRNRKELFYLLLAAWSGERETACNLEGRAGGIGEQNRGQAQGFGGADVGLTVIQEQRFRRGYAELLQAMLINFGRRLGAAEVTGEDAGVEIGEPCAAQDIVPDGNGHVGKKSGADAGGAEVLRPLRHHGRGMRPTAAVDLDQR